MKIFLILFLTSVLVRFVAQLIFIGDISFPDFDTYQKAAQDIKEGRVITNEYALPLYPLLISLSGESIGSVDLLLGSLVPWLGYKFGEKLDLSNEALFFISLSLTFSPMLIFFSSVNLTENLFMTLHLAGFYFLVSKKFFTATVFFSLAVLTRSAFEVLYFILVVGWVWRYERGFADRIRISGLCLICYAVIMSPWWLHNYYKYGEFVRTSLSSSAVLYAGNNARNTTGGGLLHIDVDFSEFDSIEDPVIKAETLTKAGLSYIVADIPRFMINGLQKLKRLWAVSPRASEFRGNIFHHVFSFYTWGLYLFAALYFFGFRAGSQALPVLSAAVIIWLCIIHGVTIGSIRYRLPAEPFLLMIGSVVVASVRQRLSKVLRGK